MAKNFPRTGKKVRPKTAIKGKRFLCAKGCNSVVASFRIRPTSLHVRQTRQEDGVKLMVMVRLEDELAP
jgi:hypothetical protein